jgi:hypothetical protein
MSSAMMIRMLGFPAVAAWDVCRESRTEARERRAVNDFMGV